MTLPNIFKHKEPTPVEIPKKEMPVVRVDTMPTLKRFFMAAEMGRLTLDWQSTVSSADKALVYQLETMRNRSRGQEWNSPTIRKFLRLVEINMVGRDGITLSNRAQDPGGTLDELANKAIENTWWTWGQRGNCDITGQLSWIDIQRLVVRSVARDGEIFIRKIYDGKYGFMLQLLEADFVPTRHNLSKLINGNYIKMGIEYTPYNKPVAYYFYKQHPGDDPLSTIINSYELLRVPANEVIHVFYKERPSQSRGYPWTTSAMLNLHMLEGFTQAEVIAARAGACQMGVLESPGGIGYTNPKTKDGKPEQISIDMAPMKWEQLPQGWSLKPFTPAHPNIQHGQFVKDIKRDISGGLGVSYNSLASDLEGVNYSSLRQGALEDRDSWKMLHTWCIETFVNEVYVDWLDKQLLAGTLYVYNKQGIPKTLNGMYFNKYNNPVWYARSWAWVDPARDMAANEKALQNQLTSKTKILAENGMDFEDLCKELAREKEIMAKYGLTAQDMESAVKHDYIVQDKGNGKEQSKQLQ